jgi:hypothetical protein
LLRYEPPIGIDPKYAPLDDVVEVAGVTIPKGSRIVLALTAATRDPELAESHSVDALTLRRRLVDRPRGEALPEPGQAHRQTGVRARPSAAHKQEIRWHSNSE